MKKFLLLFALSIVSLQFFSCTDYEGDEPVNSEPIINVYDTSDIVSNKKTKVQWYGNDIDGTNLKYYYAITTDTTVTVDDVVTKIPAQYWTETSKTFAYISMPYGAFPTDATPVYADSTTYDIKVVWSRFFVYGIDEKNAKTSIVSKDFMRTNKRPKHPMVYSTKLGLNGFDEYWMTVGADSAQMVLPAQTAFWTPFDFKWMGEDPDGPDVDLEFSWQLWERKKNGGDSVKVVESAGWSVNYLSKSFSSEIFNHNKQGKYAFKVFVRDDAFESSLNNATINFEVFAPEFDKGILVIDDTDPTLYPSSNLVNGNPDPAATSSLYDELLQNSGYKPEGQATDSLHLYRVMRFQKGTEFVGYDYTYGDDPNTPEVETDALIDSVAVYRGVYKPNIRDLTSYKLVLIVSDDRSNTNGVDFQGEYPFTGYNTYLSSYLDVGGNLFILGPSVLMGKLYTSPSMLPINKYAVPFRQVFDAYAPIVAAISSGTKDFFNKYFGIYSVTFPEQKTYFTENSTSQLCVDHYLADNYDFVGVTKYEHVYDPAFENLKLDTAKVNDAWVNRPLSTRILNLALKDNGSVFTGIPTFEAYKGETVYKYKSIYDLAHDDSLSYEINGTDTVMTHYLWCKNRVTGEVVQPVTRRSGTVATRYIAPDNAFKTAFFAIPVFFMDNSDDQVSDMFKTMIEWFDINNGGSK